MMGANTSIEWTDHSWPIVNGCRRASPGCKNCYSERLQATRLVHTPKYRGLAVYKEGKGPRYTGKTRLWEPDLTLPLRWKKPAKIFVADMGDLFYEGVLDEDIDRVFAVMSLAPRHQFQVLTKRSARMREYINGVRGRFGDINEAARKIAKRDDIAVLPTQRHGMVSGTWPLPNVWLGIIAESQEWADKRIPDLLETPAAIRWVSYEPALGSIDFHRRCALGHERSDRHFHGGVFDEDGYCKACGGGGTEAALDWIVVGGEAGPGARPFDIAWARSAVRQCREAGTACFVKQMGARPYVRDHGPGLGRKVELANRKGSAMEEWPADLRVREFPR